MAQLHRAAVQKEWVDYNGHLNVAFYVLIFDGATDAFMDAIGLTAERRDRDGNTLFTVEGHITYQREVRLGDELVCSVRLLGFDKKRIRFLTTMRHAKENYVAATMEWLHLHVDLKARKVTEMPSDILQTLGEILESQAGEAWPEEAGKSIERPEGMAL